MGGIVDAHFSDGPLNPPRRIAAFTVPEMRWVKQRLVNKSLDKARARSRTHWQDWQGRVDQQLWTELLDLRDHP